MPNPYLWPPALKSVWHRHVVGPVLSDTRTDQSGNLLLGYPFRDVREHVIEMGLADFQTGFQAPGRPRLTAEERVLLYCYMNCKKHYSVVAAAIDEYGAVKDVLARARPLVIDMGCGPGTVFLTIANGGPRCAIDYIGIDTAPAMRAKASQLFLAVRSDGSLGADSTAWFPDGWADSGWDFDPRQPVLVVCSYFFASRTLTRSTLLSLAGFVRAAATASSQPLNLLHVNSARESANRKYEIFKSFLGQHATASGLRRSAVQYRNSPSGTPDEEEFVHELLRILPE